MSIERTQTGPIKPEKIIQPEAFAETVSAEKATEEEATVAGGTSLEELALEEKKTMKDLNRIRKEIGLPEAPIKEGKEEAEAELLKDLEKMLKDTTRASLTKTESAETLSKENNDWERALALLQKYDAANIPSFIAKKFIYDKVMEILRKQTQPVYLALFENADLKTMPDREKNKLFSEFKDLDDLYFHKEKWLAENLRMTEESGGPLTFELSKSKQEALDTEQIREAQAKQHLDRMIDIINKMRGISTKERLKRIETIVDEVNKRLKDIKES